MLMLKDVKKCFNIVLIAMNARGGGGGDSNSKVDMMLVHGL